jgi:hypothetical protein
MEHLKGPPYARPFALFGCIARRARAYGTQRSAPPYFRFSHTAAAANRARTHFYSRCRALAEHHKAAKLNAIKVSCMLAKSLSTYFMFRF